MALRLDEQGRVTGQQGEAQAAGRPGQERDRRRQADSPEQDAADLAHAVPFRAAAVPRRPRRRRAPRHGAAPPLREPGHVHVVPGHLGVDAEDLPAVPAQSQAELGLFAGDDRRVEARRRGGGPPRGPSRRRRRRRPRRSACPTRGRPGGCRSTGRGYRSRRRPATTATSGRSAKAATARSSQPSPPRSRRRRTGRSATPGATCSSRSKPALRAGPPRTGPRGPARRPPRPAIGPARRCRRSSPNPRRRPRRPGPMTDSRQRRSRSPSFRPIATIPSWLMTRSVPLPRPRPGGHRRAARASWPIAPGPRDQGRELAGLGGRVVLPGGAGGAGAAHPVQLGRVGRQGLGHGVDQRLDGPGRDQPAVPARLDQLRDAGDGRADHRPAQGHRLHDHHRAAPRRSWAGPGPARLPARGGPPGCPGSR